MICPSCDKKQPWRDVFFKRGKPLKCEGCESLFYLDIEDFDRRILKWVMISVPSTILVLAGLGYFDILRYGIYVFGGVVILTFIVTWMAMLNSKTLTQQTLLDRKPLLERKKKFRRLGALLGTIFFGGSLITASLPPQPWWLTVFLSLLFLACLIICATFLVISFMPASRKREGDDHGREA